MRFCPNLRPGYLGSRAVLVSEQHTVENVVEVPGFSGRYRVSRAGEVTTSGGFLLRARRDRHGYPRVNLSTGQGRQTIYVHRLVASAFVGNPLGKPHVNHLDGDKNNNACTNLEWVTSLENNEHAERIGLTHPKFRKKAVIGVAELGFAEVRFPSMSAAERALSSTAGNTGCVSECIKGRRNRAYGYVWRLA